MDVDEVWSALRHPTSRGHSVFERNRPNSLPSSNFSTALLLDAEVPSYSMSGVRCLAFYEVDARFEFCASVEIQSGRSCIGKYALFPNRR